ncbi:MAG: tetratricopeptide repeat protein [Vampirovibrionales bacterium]|nr:tetratricopeptide repeat protein [Vampirovibrionales bacterium]
MLNSTQDSLQTVLSQAMASHEACDWTAAAAAYRLIIDNAAETSVIRADALHLLGLLKLETGDAAAAVPLMQDALKLAPKNWLIYNNYALALQRLGHLEDAKQQFEAALKLNPDYADAMVNLGALLQESGKPDDLQQAIKLYKKALRLNQNAPDVLNNLGNAYQSKTELFEAEKYYRQALALKLDFPDAHYNLGRILYEKGEFAEASSSFLKAAAYRQAFPQAYAMLGSALRQLGKLDESQEAYQLALQQSPGNARLWMNFGNVLVDKEQFEKAEQAYKKSIELDANLLQARSCRAYVLEKQGLVQDALDEYQAIYDVESSDGLLLRKATLLPVIYQDHQEIDMWRNRIESGLDALLNSEKALTMRDPLNDFNTTNFYLAYQAKNNKVIQQKTAQVLYKACPWLQTPPAGIKPSGQSADGRIKVGFISRFLSQKHTIGKLNRRMIAMLNRDKFDVTVFSVGFEYAPDESHPNTAKTTYTQLPLRDLHTSRRMITEAGLDVLFYTDFGMDPVTLLLAMGQLAPVQATTWGHPDTTGLPTMQYFVSSRLFEPEDAQSHYSEQLFMLESLLSSYYRPEVPETLNKTLVFDPALKTQFGFAAKDHLYFVPQTLFKMHPDNDPLLKGILDADPHGKIVIIRGDNRRWTGLLQQRFETVLGQSLAERIVFIEKQPRMRLIQLMAASELCLDPIHFGGGNTTYEALSVGCPVVTMPGEFMRSRPTSGFYQRMGYPDLIATSVEDMVQKSVMLATQPEARQAASEQILALNHVLYEQDEVVGEFERFFETVAKR